jgi:Mrp family chromosome partitioning ATPase
MSHLADALRRANRNAVAADVFRDDDHPWGEELGTAMADVPESAWTLDAASRPGDQGPVFIQPGSSGAGPDAAARQQLAGLIERVFLPVPGPAPRAVAFANVDSHDSSAWIAATTAAMLAQRTGASVGVVDLDFARPSIHEYFALSRAPGLVEALGSDAPLVSSARRIHGNLWVIPAGNSSGRPELSAGSRMRLTHLTAAFDHVVIILEPLAHGFGAGLATIADGIVLVIDAETTRRDTGRMVAERLQASGAAILGAILTNRRYPIPGAIYRRL